MSDIEKKVIDHDHGKYIPPSEFKNLTTKFCCKDTTSKFSNKDRF